VCQSTGELLEENVNGLERETLTIKVKDNTKIPLSAKKQD
jgi:hypothetical protein